MTRLSRERRCGRCGGVDFSRRHRRLWMRWFKGSRLLVCRQCRASLLLLRPRRPSTEG